MKKLVFIAISLLLAAGMIVPAAAEVPAAWFDLGYSNGAPVDNQGNLKVEIQAGEIVETTVTHEGVQYPVTAFVGDADQEGMLVNLPFEDVESYGEWLLGGCTFELFIELESLGEGTCGFFTCVNAGGASLYYRTGGDDIRQLQFQIGTTDNSGADNAWGAYAGAAASNAVDGPCYIEAGKILHCVGTYNKDTNMLSIYYNGKLVSSGSYGEGEFNIGSAYEDVLGIGLNPAYPSESLGAGCEFRVVGAKLYKVALSDAQVAEEYADCINTLTGTASTAAAQPVAEESVKVEEPAAVSEPVVADNPVVVNVPAVVTNPEAVTTAPKSAPQTSDFGIIAAAAAVISLAGYALSKKHGVK